MYVYSFVLSTFTVFLLLIRATYQTNTQPSTLQPVIDSFVSLDQSVNNVHTVHELGQILARSKIRKRGKKGGVKVRARRRRHRPVLPVLVTGNARSLNNKIDELEACTRYMHEYRDASLLCFSESWFKSNTPDSAVSLDGYHLVRGDRDTSICSKTRGGGVCIYINERYCHPSNVHVMKKQCLYEIEILSVSLRPYYIPREFPSVFVNIVYIPDKSNAVNALDVLNAQMTSSPDSVSITTGDFNHTTLDSALPFYQHVTCPTREDTTIDLCYSNVPGGYKCKQLPPLGMSDHNMLLLMPNYKTKLISSGVKERIIDVLDQKGTERLSDCFRCTDWQMFIDSCDTLDELNDHVSEYINFCVDTCTEKKTVKSYGNGKPWVTKELKSLLKEKRRIFNGRDKNEMKIVNNKIKNNVKICKAQYKDKIESKFRSHDSKAMWDGLKRMVGYNGKQTTLTLDKGNEDKYANDLNSFYARFDCHDFSR